MKNKKKIVSIILLLLIIFSSFFGYMQYKQYLQNKKTEEWKIYCLYRSIPTEENPTENPINKGLSIKDLKRNPPNILMDKTNGLYFCAMAYKQYTGTAINYLEIQEWMESGEFEKVTDKYHEYVDWVWDENILIQDYFLGVGVVGNNHGYNISTDSSYKDYKKVIETYPDEIDALIKLQK